MNEIDILIPNSVDVRTIEKLCDFLAVLDLITKKLQEDALSLADVRAYFEEYPDFTSFLSAGADIIEEVNRPFESGVVKILNVKQSDMEPDETSATSHLRFSTVASDFTSPNKEI